MAAEKGYIGISWTNTEAVMPAWGAKSEAIGNNPFVMAVPRKEGHIVLDMAMSQYSYGKLWVTRDKGQKLPYPGGFDHEGKLSDDPGPIAETRRILPFGYWKGSGFAVLLDIVSALFAGGLTTAGITKADKGSCGGCNQVFIAVNPLNINTQEFIDNALNETIAQIKSSVPAKENGEVFFPGENSARMRNENMELGIPVDDKIWAKVKELAKQDS
jgi:3-dehydro-L-gulonate 2-dehydrogenase